RNRQSSVTPRFPLENKKDYFFCGAAPGAPGKLGLGAKPPKRNLFLFSSVFRADVAAQHIQLAQLLDKRRATQSEQACCMRNDTTRARKRLLDELALDVQEMCAQVDAVLRQDGECC